MSSAATLADVKRPAEQVVLRELFTGILLDDAEQRAIALEDLLSKVVDDDTRLVWIGNPLRSFLTIERFLIQIVGPEIDLREERSPAELAQIIATPIGRETRVLIVVQQPETINAETIHLLVQMGWYLGREAVQVKFLFSGSTAFIVPRLAEPGLLPFSTRFGGEEAARIEALPPPPRRRESLPLLLLLLTVTGGAALSIAPADSTLFAALAALTPPATEPARPIQAPRSARAAAVSDRSPAAACP